MRVSFCYNIFVASVKESTKKDHGMFPIYKCIGFDHNLALVSFL